MPQPILQDTVRQHFVYSAGELQIIGRVLARHEREFIYLSLRNEAVVHEIHQSVMGYRREHYGVGNDATD